jgi:two-component system, cell cycle response regulator PopA
MTWTATLVIAHAPSEVPMELRSALVCEGRRCLTWQSGADAPAGLKDADVVIVTPGLATAHGETAPFPRPATNSLILALSPQRASWADAVLHPQTAIKPIADRVGALIRLRTLEWECDLRRKTLHAVGAPKLDERGTKPPAAIAVLHIGGPNPDFAHLHDTLRQSGIELRPVLRPSLALDQIEGGLVDAVLLDASVSPQTVRELSIILRRNTDLALSPVIVLDPKAAQPPTARAPSLISDIIRSRDEPELVVVRLKQLVTETRRRRVALTLLKRARARAQHDSRTGLATFKLLDAHLATHLQAVEQTGRSLSAGLLRVTPMDGPLSATELQSLGEQVGSLVSRLIRAEDMAAQTSYTSLAFLLPATLESAAQSALKRISAVLGATRFHSAKSPNGIAVEVDWTVVQPRGGQVGAELWDVGDADTAVLDAGA